MDKLNEKLDEVIMFMSTIQGKTVNREAFKNICLNSREQEIFLLLYARNGDLIDSKEIARQLGLTQEKVEQYLSDMLVRGIPFVKKYIEGKVYYVLDYEFRNLQAKENLIKISESIAREMQRNKII
ncbi:MAG: hypothetical protein V1859_00875 [archaeon]